MAGCSRGFGTRGLRGDWGLAERVFWVVQSLGVVGCLEEIATPRLEWWI